MSVAALLVIPSLVAVIVAVPGATPVATPVVGSIVATPVLLEAKVTARPESVLPPASFVTAVNAGVVPPTTTVCVVGEIVTVETGTAMTTIVAVPALPSLVAVTVSVPGVCEITLPVLVTAATASLLPPQTMVRPVSVFPAPSFVVAVSCTD